MANPFHLSTPQNNHMVLGPSTHCLLALLTSKDTDVASERLKRLNNLYSKDAPRDYFTATSGSLKTFNATEAKRVQQTTCSTNASSIESTDSEKAVKGSDGDPLIDGQVMFQTSVVEGHIPIARSDELLDCGKQAEAIIDGADRAFGDISGGQFDRKVSNDIGLWLLVATNREETEAMVEGLERAHGRYRWQ